MRLEHVLAQTSEPFEEAMRVFRCIAAANGTTQGQPNGAAVRVQLDESIGRIRTTKSVLACFGLLLAFIFCGGLSTSCYFVEIAGTWWQTETRCIILETRCCCHGICWQLKSLCSVIGI